MERRDELQPRTIGLLSVIVAVVTSIFAACAPADNAPPSTPVVQSASN
jgi:hypothetical protein